MTGWMWSLVTVLGVAVLGVVLFYGQQQSNRFRRNHGAVKTQEKATENLYRDEEKRSGDV